MNTGFVNTGFENTGSENTGSVPPNVVLTGFMGTGKTSVGRALAELLGRTFVDTDHLIELRHGSIPDIFARSGEDVFRGYERDTARALAEQEGLVISTGGRLMLDPINAELLGAAGRVFALTAPVHEILKRVLADIEGPPRPLLSGDDPENRIHRLLAERADGYGRFTIIDTQGREPTEIAADIANRLTAEPDRPEQDSDETDPTDSDEVATP